MTKKKIRIGIVGYGNIGRGVKTIIANSKDMKLVAIFTRRLDQVEAEIKDIPVFKIEEAFWPSFRDEIDVIILCGGSKEDIPIQGPRFAEHFSTIDSFDTHLDIPAYFKKMNAAAVSHGNVCVISTGWDPGLFSLLRVLEEALLPGSKSYTFWGRGVSQGHSDAARKVAGVLDARSYTIPIEEAIQQVRAGKSPKLSKREMHKRLVYVVMKEGADPEEIRKQIVEMPKYFDEYNTEVVFISQEEMKEKHSAYPHGGFVLISGVTGNGHKEVMEFSLKLESNPEFTACVLVACARAAYRLKKRGDKELLPYWIFQ
jgi:diaminopimelate dehydrogenase